jgi:hypothetical protein
MIRRCARAGLGNRVANLHSGSAGRAAAAQLLAAMTAEIAVRELNAGRRLPGARRALRRFLGADADVNGVARIGH